MKQVTITEAFPIVCKSENMFGIYLDISKGSLSDVSDILPELSMQIIADRDGMLLFNTKEEMKEMYKRLNSNRRVKYAIYTLICDNNGNLEGENT